MSKTLDEISFELYENDKKVTLIYAFNGMGKTRLSREFKLLIAPQSSGDESNDETGLSRSKILYYNAFTEDLFYWDNDLENDSEPKLKIQPNSFTEWVLKDQGQDRNIITNFQRYANQKLTPHFSEDFSAVTFSLERGDNEGSGNLKISKGEESNFIWSIFQTVIDQVISILNVAEKNQRETNQFDQLEYVFIDDPVSSLDENHLIELAVTLAELIKSSQSDLKFIITTHSPLFYNVLHNELNGKACFLLERLEDGSFQLTPKQGDSNKSFSYHLHLKQTLEQAIADNTVQKYHFTLLRNLYEKTANFLGYNKWSDLLDTVPGDKQGYLNRIIQFSSHRTLSSEEVAQPTEPEKQMVRLLLDNLLNNYGFLQQGEQNG
ncbi:MAG: anticodon nuclease [Vibrionaceae bacterium]|nr:MAG: anticodon nuclease [Vibrionaceae bacterium]